MSCELPGTSFQIWHRAMAYTVEIYKFTAVLPESERYNLSSQLRRAATSVTLNIAEGSGCLTNREFVRFLSIAYRSLKEAATGLELCQRLHPEASPDVIAMLITEGNQIRRMTYSLIQKLTRR